MDSTKWWKHCLEILVLVEMIALHNYCIFVIYIIVMPPHPKGALLALVTVEAI